MNKNDLIDALVPHLGSRAAAAVAVESFVDVVLREVAAGGSVAITGFGTFERVQRAARTGRNPHTGQPVPIAAKSSPRFRPGTYFRSVVADPDELPADGLAGARVGSAEPGRGEQARSAPTAHRTAGPGPASVRRTASATPEPSSAPGAQEGQPESRRPRTGTPASVKADPATRSAEKQSVEPRRVATGGRMMLGGEEITRSMIRAKKAELARAKNDVVAKKKNKKDKDAQSAKAGKGKGLSAKKGSKGKDAPAQKGKKKAKGEGKKQKG